MIAGCAPAVLSLRKSRMVVVSAPDVAVSLRASMSGLLFGFTAHRLDAVAVRVEDEGGIVRRAVVRTQAGRAVVAAALGQGRRMEGTHGSPAGGTQGPMALVGHDVVAEVD